MPSIGSLFSVVFISLVFFLPPRLIVPQGKKKKKKAAGGVCARWNRLVPLFRGQMRPLPAAGLPRQNVPLGACHVAGRVSTRFQYNVPPQERAARTKTRRARPLPLIIAALCSFAHESKGDTLVSHRSRRPLCFGGHLPCFVRAPRPEYSSCPSSEARVIERCRWLPGSGDRVPAKFGVYLAEKRRRIKNLRDCKLAPAPGE